VTDGSIQSFAGGEVVWKPFPKQRLALACPAFELLYGGSKGGMKTNFLVASPAQILAKAHEKWQKTGREQRTVRVMVFRKNLNDLKDFIAKSFELYPYLDPQMGANGWHEKEKYWRFSSGATVEMNHLDDPKSHESFNGQEFAALLIDEVQFISYEAYSYLLAQVRSKDPDFARLTMVRATANPGGPHGDWVRKHFHIDEQPGGGRIFSEKVKLRDGSEREVTRAFIRSYLRDNPLFADGAYEANLRASMTADEVRMYLDGDFDCVAGAFFSSLLRDVHFVKSFPIPGDWGMIHSTDWGSSSPSSTLIGARDKDNRIHVIDELHAPGITGSHYGGLMEDMWRRQKWSNVRKWARDDFWGVIDTQAMHKHNGPATPAAGIMEHGFRLFAADKLPGERLTGINQMKERLLMDRFGRPQVVIFEDRCPNLARAIKAIQSQAPIDPNDYEERSPHSHSIDSWRFMCMKWPVEPADERNQQDAQVEAWLRLTQQKQQNQGWDDGGISGYG
jgi:hypothetical protein